MGAEILENAAAWPQILLDFGPYAILALFALWIAPRQLTKFTDLNPKDILGRKVCGSIAGCSWVIVLALAVFITISWSPIKGDKGNLGKLAQTAKIYPTDNIIYLNSSGISGTDKESWQFAVVSKKGEIAELPECVGFTIYWDDNNSNDFEIPTAFFLSKKVKDYKFTKAASDASLTYIPKERKWSENVSCDAPTTTTAKFNFGWDAHANNHLHNILRDMKSSNRSISSQARKQMRSLPNNQLQNLRGIAPNNSHEKNLIVTELRRRGLN